MGYENSRKFNKWGDWKYSKIEEIGSWNNCDNSYIYTIGLTIPTKVGALSVTKCNGFSFLVHIGANCSV